MRQSDGNEHYLGSATLNIDRMCGKNAMACECFKGVVRSSSTLLINVAKLTYKGDDN